MKNLEKLPQNIPVPINDGACNHLEDRALPSIVLPSTQSQC
jgi:hypothetical protein